MTYYILTYIKYYAILTHRVLTKVTRRGTPPWVYLFVWLFCLPGNFVEIVLVSKKAPRGSHCGGGENIAVATRRRRGMSQATFFILYQEISLK